MMLKQNANKKGYKAKIALTTIACILLVTMIGGILAFFLNKNNTVSNSEVNGIYGYTATNKPYSLVFDLKSGYDEMREELGGNSIDSVTDSSFGHSIVLDIYQLDKYQVIHKQLGRIKIDGVVVRTIISNGYKKSYIFFDCEKIRNIIQFDNNLYITSANITSGVNHQEGVRIDGYSFDGKEISEELYYRERERYLSYFGLSLNENLNSEYNYCELDNIHFTVYTEFLRG